MSALFRLRAVPLILCLMMAAGCGVPKRAGSSIGIRTKPQFTMQVNVTDNANQNNPIPMDFVMVIDKKLVKEVAKLSAKDWFERRIQVQRDFPGKVAIASWEWVPGQQVGPISIDIDKGVRGSFLFANYLNGGDHRAYVDVRAPIAVSLAAEDFTLQPLR